MDLIIGCSVFERLSRADGSVNLGFAIELWDATLSLLVGGPTFDGPVCDLGMSIVETACASPTGGRSSIADIGLLSAVGRPSKASGSLAMDIADAERGGSWPSVRRTLSLREKCLCLFDGGGGKSCNPILTDMVLIVNALKTS
jgi:hypothetical protein